MSSINKVILIGRLGRDPEYKQFASGQGVCKLVVATSERWISKDGNKQEKTEWHNISVFSKRGEKCATYLHKGSEVYVEGRLETRSYEKEGQKHYSTDIVANDVQFLSKVQKQQDTAQAFDFQEPTEQVFVDDEMPF